MSADRLLSIVAPAAVPVAAPAASDARGDSGFDRMLGEAMAIDSERPGSVGRSETVLIRVAAAALRPTALSTAIDSALAAAEDSSVDAETTASDAAGAAAAASAAAETPHPSVSVKAAKHDEAQVLPAAPAGKGVDQPQVLPGAPPVTVEADVEAPAPPVRNNKGADTPQVLPGTVGSSEIGGGTTGQVASGKGADVPQVLPGTTDKSGNPQVLPGADPTPVINPAIGKDGGRQILPGTQTDTPTTAEPANPAVTSGATKAAALAAAALAPAVAPPPSLRPATDRNAPVSNSMRATTSTGERTSVAAPATATSTPPAPPVVEATPSATAATPPSLSDRPPAGTAAAVPVPVPAIDDATVKAPVDQAPAETLPATATQAGTASQTHSLSNLSNAAVEATAQMAAQIIRRMDARSTRFEMALTPDELGRVDVSLDIDEHGRLAARLAFDNPAAALDMKGRVDELRRQLEDAGFHLADDAFQFTDRDRSSGEAFDRRQGRAFAAASRLSDETDAAAPVTAPRWMSLSLTPDRVDMKV